MSDYDPFDDLPGYMAEFTDYPKNYIRLDKLEKWLDCYPFYIGDNLDSYMEEWRDFLEYVTENKELRTYDLRFLDYLKLGAVENYLDEKVRVIPRDMGDMCWGDYVNKDEFFELAATYGISSKNMFEKIMGKTLAQYEFILEMFKSNDFDYSNFHTKNNDFSQTSKATQIRQENALKDWQQAFRYMIEIRDTCLKLGPEKRTERQLWKMFEDKGYKITKSQMKYFKTLLPDGYVDREGGAPRQ